MSYFGLLNVHRFYKRGKIQMESLFVLLNLKNIFLCSLSSLSFYLFIHSFSFFKNFLMGLKLVREVDSCWFQLYRPKEFDEAAFSYFRYFPIISSFFSTVILVHKRAYFMSLWKESGK